MTEEQTELQGIEGEQEPVENVRKSAPFQAVTRQLNEERAKQAEMAGELDKLKAAEEQRQLMEAEKAGEYDKVKATYEAKIDAMTAEMEATKQQAQTTAITSDVKAALAAKGVQSAKALEFIARDYLAQEERGDIAEWVESVATADDYAVFFGASTPPAGAPKPASAGSVSAGSVNWTETKDHLNGKGTPAQAKMAMKAVQDYIGQHGKAPF